MSVEDNPRESASISEDLTEEMSPGERLREIRVKQGLSTRQAGERSGLNSGSISQLETGYTKDPGILKIPLIAKTYGISTEELLAVYGIDVTAPGFEKPELSETDRQLIINYTNWLLANHPESALIDLLRKIL